MTDPPVTSEPPHVDRSPARGPIWVAGAGLAALVLGWIGIGITTGSGGAVDALYRSLQLFVLDGGALQDLTRPLNVVVQIARFLAPAVTVSAILVAVGSLFADTVRRLGTTLLTGHAVVCGDSDEARILAANLQASGRRVLLVSRSKDGVPRGVPVVVGDPRDPRTLRTAGTTRATDMFTFAEHAFGQNPGGIAVTTAVALVAGRLRRPRRAPQLTTFAEVTSDDLGEALWLRATAGPSVAPIDFFSLTDVATRVLLRTESVATTTPVVIGSGEFGSAVRREISRTRPVGHHPRMPDPDVIAAWRSTGVNQVFVCVEREQEAITTALRLAAGDPPWRIVLCLPRRAPFADALGDGSGVSVFGVLDGACRAESIAEASLTRRLDNVNEKLARAIHAGYLAAARRKGATGDGHLSAVEWDQLTEALRESNREQARSIGYYLSEVGARIAFEPSAPFRFTSDEIELLSRREHVRWVRERQAAGMRWGPERTDTEHPDLVEWSKLSHGARRKDADAILRIPDLLDSEGLYLRRMDDRGGQ